jgi:transcriptional regulator with XRE-family HTH domain
MNKIASLRKEKELTLKAFGKAVGMRDNTLSRYETGKREPKLATWQKLADFFGVSVGYLQGIEGANYCPYCHGGRKAQPIIDNKIDFLAFDTEGGVAFASGGSFSIYAVGTIKFCPMCGRKLGTEEIKR